MKRNEKSKKMIRGSISVLLVIILLPMMTFSAMIVDMSRINMARQMMSSAGDLTMNTALANYDTILKDVYGLFAMSQIEGMDNEQLGTELNNYFARTLTAYGVVAEEDSADYVATLIGDFRDILNNGTVDTTNFLELNNIKVTATTPAGSSLANSSILRKQIVEYMKYRAPLGVGVSFLESLTAFEKMDDQNEVVEAQVAAQESTQDVTKACQKLIQLIRAYDKRVVEINGALTGVSSSTDATVIPLEDYDTHVNQYLAAWGENYTHINKLNLVFLANSPSADGVYLKALPYGTVFFVGFDGTVYGGSDTGITVQVTLAGDTASAAQQITDQITNLNNNYKQYADKYSASMLPSKLLTYNANNIDKCTISKTNEDAAITSFMKFEKFLLDQTESGSITYSQVKSVLEQIYVLEQYRANYEAKINADIAQAEAERDAAQTALDNLVTARDDAQTAMDDRINLINERIDTYVNQFDGLDDAVAFLSGKKVEIKEVLNHLPERTLDYDQYYNLNIAYGNWDIYAEYFKWLIQDSSFGKSGTSAQKKIISEAKKYVEKNGYDANGFDAYMKGVLSDKQEGEDLFQLLCCLKTCHAYAITYKSSVGTYTNAVSQIPDAEIALSNAKQKVFDLNDAKTKTLNKVKGCLQGYNKFCSAYQADAYYYGYYIVAAKNTVGAEALAIQTHFAQLIAYVEELRGDLDEISTQITKVKNAIKTYNTNLDKWETANQSYETNNGGDSFSGQTSDDITKARTEYDEDLYDTLDTFVIALWNEFDDLYSKLTEATNFTYGSKRIDVIKTAQDLIDAVSGTTLSAVVTPEEAGNQLATLYKAESVEYDPYTMNYTNPKQLCFLSPQILQIQALKYLNSAYPDEALLDQKEKTENQKKEAEYEAAKDKLTGKNTTTDSGNSGGSGDGGNTGSTEETKPEVSDNVETDFGYTFESNKIQGSLPSNSVETDKKEFKEEEYQLDEIEGEEGEEPKLDASTSVGGQSDKSNSVLKGIGDIATTAVENLYILNYVFENFSYNTIVQEQILEDNKISSKSVIGQITDAKSLFSNAETVAASKGNITTLSNYPINEKNNHLFGAEIEYILFGNANPKTNVTSAKASIYAIRFGFNCIFAFTDSEIRNTTMAAGLAVQAATLGIVPYQVVQIVLQLALAAAESAIDLSAMNHGLDVVIIKTKDTWSLSVSGAADVLGDAANAAAKVVTDKVVNLVDEEIKRATNGLNDLIDAGAEELEGAIAGVTESMSAAAEGALESVVDSVLSSVMSKIEEGLNELQYVGVGDTTVGELKDQLPTQAEVRAEAVALFEKIEAELDSIVASACGDNAMANAIAASLKEQAEALVRSMRDKVLAIIDDPKNELDIAGVIAGKLNELKLELINQGNLFIETLEGEITLAASQAVSETSDKLKGYISQCGEDLSEEAADAIKKEISSLTDNFVNSTLKINSTSPTTDVKSSPVSMFQFGYKDYLMLLTYISICCGDSVLVRTADVIQMNLQNAGEGASFNHKANTEDGKFLMSKAYTYISINATADLDMFFMDFEIFASQVEEPSTEPGATGATGETEAPAEEEKSGTSIEYNGILGY